MIDEIAETIDDLHRVADTHRKHQERHQHRVRVKAEAHEVEQPHLPDHRHRGTQQRRGSEPAAAGVDEQHHRGDRKRHQEEQPHQGGALNEVADQLGEAGDADIDGVRGVLVSHQLLEVVRKAGIVQALARVGVCLDQRRDNNGGFEVVGDKASDLARLEHVLAQRIQGALAAVVVIGDDRATDKALLRDLHPARIGGPQGLQRRAVDAVDVKDFVGNAAQQILELLGKDVALGGLDNDSHRVAQPLEIILAVEEVLDVGVRYRQHLLEAGIGLELARLPAEEHRCQRKQQDQGQAHPHQQSAQQRAQFAVFRFYLGAFVVGHRGSASLRGNRPPSVLASTRPPEPTIRTWPSASRVPP